MEGLFAFGVLLVELNLDPAVEKGQFAQPVGQNVPLEMGGGENRVVGRKGDFGSRAGAGADDFQRGHRYAALVTLAVNLAVAPDLDLQPLAQRVDAGGADAVQAAGNLVTLVVELAARVQDGQHDLDGGALPGRMHSD